MARRKATQSLHVGINGRYVGQLERRSGTHAFTYSDEWLASDDAHAISLSMPITRQRHTGNEVRFYFDNLLPDDAEVRRLIVDRVGAYSVDTMDLLSEIGRDCVGALSFTTEPVSAQLTMDMRALDDKGVVKHLKHAATRRTLGMDDDGEFRISLAGAQEKTALTWHNGKWNQPLGITPTTHIFKLPMGDLENGLKFTHSVDNEWFCLRVMHHLGLPVAQADIAVFDDSKVLIVERFDRAYGDDGQLYRLTQEDMCQALGKAGQSKYESHGGPGAKEISELLRFSANSEADQYTFFLAQYVFWLLMGIDGHAKNFSIYLDHTGYWLTPLYDVISAHPIANQFRRRELKMAMRVLSKNSHYIWHDIQSRHWISHAQKSGLNVQEAQHLIDATNARLVDAIDLAFLDANEHFHQEEGEKIAQGITSVL